MSEDKKAQKSTESKGEGFKRCRKRKGRCLDNPPQIKDNRTAKKEQCDKAAKAENMVPVGHCNSLRRALGCVTGGGALGGCELGASQGAVLFSSKGHATTSTRVKDLSREPVKAWRSSG